MGAAKPWDEMTIDEKLQALSDEVKSHQRHGAVMTKAMDEMRRRVEQIERRLEDLMLD